jgi:hypothetical protein
MNHLGSAEIASAVTLVGLVASACSHPPPPGGGLHLAPRAADLDTYRGSVPDAPISRAVIWQRSIDLDGDGAAEELSFVSSDWRLSSGAAGESGGLLLEARPCGSSCSLDLTIDDRVLEVPVDDDSLAMAVRLVDLEADDGRRELLMWQRAGDDEISTASVELYVVERGEVEHHVLWRGTWPGNDMAIDDLDDGGLRLRLTSCAQVIERVVRRRGGRVRVERHDVQTTPHADECAG